MFFKCAITIICIIFFFLPVTAACQFKLELRQLFLQFYLFIYFMFYRSRRVEVAGGDCSSALPAILHCTHRHIIINLTVCVIIVP